MDKELVKEIVASGSAALSALAEAAKTTAEHLYSVLIRQQIVEGLVLLIQIVLYCLVAWFGGGKIYKWVKKGVNAPDSYPSAEGEYIVSGLIAFMALSAATMLMLRFVGEAIGKLVNPEYYAIKFILESARYGIK